MSVRKLIVNLANQNYSKSGVVLCSVKLNRIDLHVWNKSFFTYTSSLSQPLDRKPESGTAKQAMEKYLKSGKKHPV